MHGQGNYARPDKNFSSWQNTNGDFKFNVVQGFNTELSININQWPKNHWLSNCDEALYRGYTNEGQLEGKVEVEYDGKRKRV